MPPDSQYGTILLREDRALLLTEHIAKGYCDGTHRTVAPAETLERVRPFFPQFGITRLANVTGLDDIGIPVVMSCRPNSRSLAVSQGKGRDLLAAKASAAMEAIEGYHAERIRLPLRLASYADLRAARENVIDVSLLCRPRNSRYHDDLPILWVQGEDWLSGGKVWVPFQLVHCEYTVDLEFDIGCFTVSSTGLASGNHLLEAVSHGLSEVVERDADVEFNLLSSEEQERRRVDLDTVDHPHCRELLERCFRAGVSVSLWDLTTRVGLAAFRCQITPSHQDPMRRLMCAGGYGCHPVREIAFQRALTEAVQSRLTAISGARDDMPRHDYLLWRDPDNLEACRLEVEVSGTRPYSQVPTFEADSFEEDVEHESKLVQAAGFRQVIVVDLTLPEFRIPVVRVLVPGAEHQGGRSPGASNA